LGVAVTSSQEELRRAYRRLLRATHPDTGGNAARFTAVQLAWERIGDPSNRAAYDQGRTREPDAASARPAPPARSGPKASAMRARSYGHPGGQARDCFTALMREWVGRGVPLDDPYDPALVRSAPREVRHWLAKALAEEATARAVGGLGIGYTIWNDVASHDSVGNGRDKVDHVVLGPAGLFAVQSEDWGSAVRVVRGELVADGLAAGAEPARSLSKRARRLGKSLGVRFTALAIVVPDDATTDPVLPIGRGRHRESVLVQRTHLPRLLRDGLSDGPRTSIGEVFEVRTRLQDGIRFV
jgi:hypothetical protein